MEKSSGYSQLKQGTYLIWLKFAEKPVAILDNVV